MHHANILLSLSDGAVVRGSINVKTYGPMTGRLVDCLNHNETFVVLTNVEVVTQPAGVAALQDDLEVLFVNKRHIVWASPQDADD